VSPNATHFDVVGKIVYLRQNYHFGPGKIAMYLKRYHDVEISQSGVWRILKRLDMSRLPSSQRYKRLDKRRKRYEKQLPGHQVQVDVKFVDHPSYSLDAAVIFLGLVMATGSLLLHHEFTERRRVERNAARIGFTCMAVGGVWVDIRRGIPREYDKFHAHRQSGFCDRSRQPGDLHPRGGTGRTRSHAQMHAPFQHRLCTALFLFTLRARGRISRSAHHQAMW
jgi:hypothetical protein